MQSELHSCWQSRVSISTETTHLFSFTKYITDSDFKKKINNNNNYSDSKEVSSHCITLHLTSKQP